MSEAILGWVHRTSSVQHSEKGKRQGLCMAMRSVLLKLQLKNSKGNHYCVENPIKLVAGVTFKVRYSELP